MSFNKHKSTSVTKLLLNRHGSALTMTLIAAIGLGVVSLVYLNSAKMSQKLNVKQQGDTDVENAVLTISSFLRNPYNCTATFYGLPRTNSSTDKKSLTYLKSCNGGTCHTGTEPNQFGVRTGTAESNWNDTIPYSSGGTGLSKNIRIKEMSYYLDTAEIDNIPPLSSFPAIITLEITFQKNLGKNATKDTSGANFTANGYRDTSFVIKKIPIQVIMPDETSPHLSHPTILGCPRSTASTLPPS